MNAFVYGTSRTAYISGSARLALNLSKYALENIWLRSIKKTSTSPNHGNDELLFAWPKSTFCCRFSISTSTYSPNPSSSSFGTALPTSVIALQITCNQFTDRNSVPRQRHARAFILHDDPVVRRTKDGLTKRIGCSLHLFCVLFKNAGLQLHVLVHRPNDHHLPSLSHAHYVHHCTTEASQNRVPAHCRYCPRGRQIQLD